MGCHSLLQGIFLTQGLNRGHLHYRQIFLFLPSEPPGKPFHLLRGYMNYQVRNVGRNMEIKGHFVGGSDRNEVQVIGNWGNSALVIK